MESEIVTRSRTGLSSVCVWTRSLATPATKVSTLDKVIRKNLEVMGYGK
jgi:hypothetical protein